MVLLHYHTIVAMQKYHIFGPDPFRQEWRSHGTVAVLSHPHPCHNHSKLLNDWGRNGWHSFTYITPLYHYTLAKAQI